MKDFINELNDYSTSRVVEHDNSCCSGALEQDRNVNNQLCSQDVCSVSAVVLLLSVAK